MKMYDPPLSFENLPEHLRTCPIHSWRAITGIELIHPEPTWEEFERICENWRLMPSVLKAMSDFKSLQLFGITNAEHEDRIRQQNQK